jgi:hypothetical protein
VLSNQSAPTVYARRSRLLSARSLRNGLYATKRGRPSVSCLKEQGCVNL